MHTSVQPVNMKAANGRCVHPCDLNILYFYRLLGVEEAAARVVHEMALSVGAVVSGVCRLRLI